MIKTKVIKFGGTSLSHLEDRHFVIDIIKEELKDYKLIVVVSAMGRYPEPYATDTLLKMGKHLPLKAKDEIMSCGEIISSHHLCDLCIQEGLNTTCLNIIENGIKTDTNYGDGQVQFVDTNTIYDLLNDYDVLIVPGFFGTNYRYFVTSLGRGGSDYSAVLLASHLGLKDVTIYSDVPGIFSADPKIIKNAVAYPYVNILQARNLSYLGVRVIHHKACDLALEKKIRLILKSTFIKNVQTIVDEKAPMHHFLIVKEDAILYVDHFNQLTQLAINEVPESLHDQYILKKDRKI